MRSLTQQVNMEHRTLDSENAKAAIRHIARLNAKRLFINEAYSKRIDANSNLRYYFDSCVKEIEAMKKAKFDNTCLSFYDIFKKDTRQLAIYASKRNIVEDFQSYERSKIFPIYAHQLMIRFKKGQERESLLSKLSLQSFHSLIGYELPYHVSQNIQLPKKCGPGAANICMT